MCVWKVKLLEMKGILVKRTIIYFASIKLYY